VSKPPRIGRKLLAVLRHAEHGLDSGAVSVHRLARARDSAERRGLIAERLPRDRRGAIYGLTERGAAMLAAWRAQFGTSEPITDEML
jgi:DNA-binding PadR family transcriptional regulator